VGKPRQGKAAFARPGRLRSAALRMVKKRPQPGKTLRRSACKFAMRPRPRQGAGPGRTCRRLMRGSIMLAVKRADKRGCALLPDRDWSARSFNNGEPSVSSGILNRPQRLEVLGQHGMRLSNTNIGAAKNQAGWHRQRPDEKTSGSNPVGENVIQLNARPVPNRPD